VRFADRRDAGRQLATLLVDVVGDRALVLALPRGGVPVGYEIARTLSAPLDIWGVRKVGAPGNPELGLGAVTEGGYTYVNREVVSALGLSDEEVQPLVETARQELRERVRQIRSLPARVTFAQRDVVVVDDGVATGGTLTVALQSIASFAPRSITVAVPVVPAQIVNRLSELVNRVVYVKAPDNLRAVGMWYEDFAPVADGEVRQLLRDGNVV
jgi:putative phosphoribosyl transferase